MPYRFDSVVIVSPGPFRMTLIAAPVLPALTVSNDRQVRARKQMPVSATLFLSIGDACGIDALARAGEAFFRGS